MFSLSIDPKLDCVANEKTCCGEILFRGVRLSFAPHRHNCVSRRGALGCASRMRRQRSQNVFEKKGPKSGISITESSSCYRRQLNGVSAVRSPEPSRPVKPPTRLSQPPQAETLFFLVVDDREGVEAADLDSMSWLSAVRLSAGPRAISHHRWFQHYGSNGLKVDRILSSALRKRALTDHPVPLQHDRN